MKVLRLLVVLGSIFLSSAAAVAELIKEGDELDASGQNAKALVLFLEADEQKPGDSEILRRIAKQYTEQMVVSGADRQVLGEKALDYGKQAVVAGPKNAQAHLALAIIYGKVAFLRPPKERMEFSSLIKQEAQTAVDLDPKNDLAWHVLGRWNYEVANLSGPMKFFAETLYGKMPEASNEKAFACFQKALALKPDRLLNAAELGRTLAVLGRKDEARAALEKALEMPAREKNDEETKTRARKALEALD